MSDEGKDIGIQLQHVPTMTCSGCKRVLDVSEIPPFTEVECPDCGRSDVVPARLGHFRLLRLIGTGGMGGVYHAVDESLGRDVAIKVMLKSLGDDVEFVETFRREAQAAAQLNHPNIAQIYSFGQEAGQPYIVMELISGKRLDRMMEKQGALDPSFVVQVVLEIAQGLSAAGEIGLIHGDIKPENILFDERGQAKLVDFGLASFVNQQAAGGIWGTPYYIAPEKVRRQKVDARADIYSLGATFYHAVTGKPPFEGKTPLEVVKARLKDLPPPPKEVLESVSPKVSDIVMRMLQTSPTRRYPTYASLISDLKRVAEELPKPRGLATTKTFKRRVKGRRRATGPLSTSESGDLGPTTSPSRIVINRTATGEESPLSDYNPLKEAADDAEARRKKRGAVLGTIFGILLVVGLGGGGFYGYLKYQESVESRKLRLAYLQKMGNAEDLNAELCAEVAGVEGYAEKYAPLMKAVTNDLNAIVASALKSPPPKETGYPGQRAIHSDILKSARDIGDARRQARGYRNRVELILKDMKASLAAAEKVPLDLTEADERITKISDTIKATQEAAALCEEKLKLMGEQASQIHSVRTRVVEDRAAAAVAAEEEKRRQEEERKKREEEEKKNKVREAEIAKANAVIESVKKFTVTRDYPAAVDILRKELSALKLKQCQDIVKPVLERFNHLIDLQKGITAMLAAKPMKWGWIQDGQKVDVLGASKKGVNVKGGRIVAWPNVKTVQMFHFVKVYTEIRSGGSRARGKRYLEAAVFCYASGDSEAARKLAREFSGRAVETVPSLKEDVVRIMPDL